MKHVFFLAILFLGLSCNSRYEWVDDLDSRIKAYDKGAQLQKEEYKVNSGTSTAIYVAPYKEQNGIRKTVFRHTREETMYFERHIYFEGENIVYEHHVGIAPRLVKEEDKVLKTSKYMIFDKKSFFKNDEVGKRFGRQKVIDEFIPKDSVSSVLQNLTIEESFLYRENYLEIKNYLKDILALQRVKE